MSKNNKMASFLGVQMAVLILTTGCQFVDKGSSQAMLPRSLVLTRDVQGVDSLEQSQLSFYFDKDGKKYVAILAYSFKEQLNTDQPKTWIYYEQGAVENLPGDGVRLRREESSCPDNRSLGDGIELTSRFTKKGDQWGYLETLQKPKAADLYDVKSFSGRLPEMPTQSSLVGQNAGIGCLERGDDGVMYYRVKH